MVKKYLTKTNLIIAFSSVVVIVLLGLLWWYSNLPGTYDAFARCLQEKGAKFYGAFWCPHCQNQKKTFGSSQEFLPYVECSTPDGKSQLQVCEDAGVAVYPTWTFSDGSKEEGELTFQTLAEKTGCILP